MIYLLIFLGGGIGAAARHGVNVATLKAFGPGLPWGTLFVNVAGSLAMGILIGLFALKADVSASTRTFLTTGLLGGFTTFSAFSLEVVNMWERGQAYTAAAYALTSVLIGVLALFSGLLMVRS